MKIELKDDGVIATITVISSILNASNGRGAVEMVKLIADVDIKRSGWLRHTAIISGERSEVLKVSRVLLRHTDKNM